MVDANYRPVADPDNYAGEVFEYNPSRTLRTSSVDRMQ
jgi:hypothetical protein